MLKKLSVLNVSSAAVESIKPGIIQILSEKILKQSPSYHIEIDSAFIFYMANFINRGVR